VKHIWLHTPVHGSRRCQEHEWSEGAQPCQGTVGHVKVADLGDVIAVEEQHVAGLDVTVHRAMAGVRGKIAEEKLGIDAGGSDHPNQKAVGSASAMNTTISTDPHEWAVEVYRGNQSTGDDTQIDDGVLEFDLDEEEVEQASKYLAIAVFYSRKSYNPQYSFKLEFGKEEKTQVIDGGLWRHKGDALIVVHYNGLSMASEVHMESIGLWIHFYDLPPAMMK
jgi:hypothetical protein